MSAIQSRESLPRSDTLILLYQGVFTGIVRLQAGRQRLADPVTFRRRIKEALLDVDREAASAGYSARDIRDAESAVVALLDETILTLKDPGRDKWSKQTLSVELYGEASAGEVFFDRLDGLRGQTDSPHLADVLEVYLLCLLLGFEGKYSGPLQAEAQLIADRLRSRIDGIRGVSSYHLSPPFDYANAGLPAQAQAAEDMRWRLWLIGAVCAPVAVFLLYKIQLAWRLSEFAASIPGLK